MARRGVISEEVIQVNDIISGFTRTPAFENIRDYHPGVSFRMDCDPNLLNIKGSPVHLEKTLMNLVSNAAESISGEGEVVIRTENRYLDKAVVGYDEVREGDYVVLSVSDTGTGISDEHREKIFEPFYTKKAMGRSGTGLGLTIVWGTVKDHNGYIDVSSRVGEGTTFTLYFPATRDEQTAPPERTPVERYMGRVTPGGHSDSGHDHGAGDGRNGGVPEDPGNPPAAEGDSGERFLGNVPRPESAVARGGRICQKTLCDGNNRSGPPKGTGPVAAAENRMLFSSPHRKKRS